MRSDARTTTLSPSTAQFRVTRRPACRSSVGGRRLGRFRATPLRHRVGMHERFASIAAIAAANHGVVGVEQLERSGLTLQHAVEVARRRVARASRTPVLRRRRGAANVAAPARQCDRRARRSRLPRRTHRRQAARARRVHVRGGRGTRSSTCQRHRRPGSAGVHRTHDLDAGSTVTIDGFRCLTAERLILDAPLFDFSRAEIENAIDSAIRLRKVSEQRLRTKVIARHDRGINHGRVLSMPSSTPVARAAWSAGRCTSSARRVFLVPCCDGCTATTGGSSLASTCSSATSSSRSPVTARIPDGASCRPTSNGAPS